MPDNTHGELEKCLLMIERIQTYCEIWPARIYVGCAWIILFTVLFTEVLMGSNDGSVSSNKVLNEVYKMVFYGLGHFVAMFSSDLFEVIQILDMRSVGRQPCSGCRNHEG